MRNFLADYMKKNIRKNPAPTVDFLAKLLMLCVDILEVIPNMPMSWETINGCFHIPLTNGYVLSVSIPSDKNRNLAHGLEIDSIMVETALLKDNELIYDNELGYSDVRTINFDAYAILAEYKRLMALLSEQE